MLCPQPVLAHTPVRARRSESRVAMKSPCAGRPGCNRTKADCSARRARNPPRVVHTQRARPQTDSHTPFHICGDAETALGKIRARDWRKKSRARIHDEVAAQTRLRIARKGTRLRAVIQWNDIVSQGFAPPQLNHHLEPFRFLCRKILDFRIIARDVVEFPAVIVVIVACLVVGYRFPAVVIDAPLAAHLKILGMPARFRIGVAERVGERGSMQRKLLHTTIDRRAYQFH